MTEMTKTIPALEATEYLRNSLRVKNPLSEFFKFFKKIRNKRKKKFILNIIACIITGPVAVGIIAIMYEGITSIASEIIWITIGVNIAGNVFGWIIEKPFLRVFFAALTSSFTISSFLLLIFENDLGIKKMLGLETKAVFVIIIFNLLLMFIPEIIKPLQKSGFSFLKTAKN